MKDLKILILLPALLLLTLLINIGKPKLATGDIAFTSYNSKNDDSFSIIILKDLPSHTNIFFTDAEWNGTRFKIEENDLIWNSGTNSLSAFTEIKFTNIKTKPISNFGFVLGNLNLNQKGDAIFAYTGEGFKQPQKFIAAVSNDYKHYGTLLNTNLEEGNTAIIYPKNTYSAVFKEQLKSTKQDIIEQLNDFNNYQILQRNSHLVHK